MDNKEMLMAIKKPLIAIFLIALLLLLILSWLLGYRFGMNKPIPDIIQHDTIRVTQTIYKTVYETDTITKFVYKPYSVIVKDTLSPGDTTDVDLPFIEAYAGIPDTLDIWYHGWIDIGIDSIRYGVFKTTEIVNNIIEKPYYVTPRIMLNAGIEGFYFNKPYGVVFAEADYNAKFMTYKIFGGYGTDFCGLNKPFFGGGIVFRLDIK